MADEVTALSHQEISRRGGVTRAKKLTSDQRRDIARRAAHARWGKKADAPNPPPPSGPPNGGLHATLGGAVEYSGDGSTADHSGYSVKSDTRKPVSPVSTTSQPGGLRAAA